MRYKKYSNSRELVQGGGIKSKDIAKWIGIYEWTLYVHLTFKKSIYDPTTARNLFVKWFNEALAKLVPHTGIETVQGNWNGLSFFITIETYGTWGGVHIHGVLGINSAEIINIKKIKRSWQSWYGIANIEFYDKELDGASYISKFAANERNWWDCEMPKWEIQNLALYESARKRKMKETAARFRAFGIIPPATPGAGV